MAYLWFKAFHLIGIVVWFAGLFYLARLFIYHVEANELPEPARKITIAMAIGILTTEPEVLKQGWLHIKLLFVAILIGYHHYCSRLMKQLAADECRWSSQQLRAFNEAPTVMLVAIVMLAIFKNDLPTNLTAWVIFGMIIAMAATIQLYARKRRLDQEKLMAQMPQE